MVGKVTLRDVAAKAGVSYQTVSKVLNDKGDFSSDTKNRVWAAIEELKYRPNISARNLRTQSSNLIGFGWLQAESGAPRPILDAFLYSTVCNFEAAGYHLLTFLVADMDDTAIYQKLYRQRQVEGFVMADTMDLWINIDKENLTKVIGKCHMLKGTFKGKSEIVKVEGLGQVVVSALFDSFNSGIDGGIGGHNDDRNVFIIIF